jgi:hypothetical protein
LLIYTDRSAERREATGREATSTTYVNIQLFKLGGSVPYSQPKAG